MKICNFTMAELDTFRRECNFTDIEQKCFELKARDCTDVQLSIKLNISESTAAVVMRRIRAKITNVMERNTRQAEELPSCGCGKTCIGIISHTMAEWAKIPDFLSKKGAIYIYEDYRTDNNVNVPRIKIGDGVNSISMIPFATMSITDDDLEYWDNKPDTESHDFGKVIVIGEDYKGNNRFVFPSDGYLTLDFDVTKRDEAPQVAEAVVYGASGRSGFTLSKNTDRDDQSKEVYVRKGMQCEHIVTSGGAEIKFYPLM